MASMVGWATFAVEHVMFGVAVAAYLLATSPDPSPSPQMATDRQSPVPA